MTHPKSNTGDHNCTQCRIRRALIVAALLLASVQISQAEESEAWYVVKFDNQTVGFEQIKTRTPTAITDAPLQCYRKTELNLNRMGQNLTVHATLWTTQSATGVLQKFNLQRVDGAGNKIERSGVFNAKDQVFVIQEVVAGRRRDFRVTAPPKTRSPMLSLWVPRLAATLERQATLPVFFPETAGISGISVEPIHQRPPTLGRRAHDTRVEFYPEGDPARRTTLLTDATLKVIRHDKQFMNRTLSMERTSAEQALAASADKSLDLNAQTIVPVNGLLPARESSEKLVLELLVTNGFLPAIPNSTFQSVERLSDSTARITLWLGTTPRSAPSVPSTSKQMVIAATRWMPVTDPALQRMALMTSGGENDAETVCRRMEAAVHSKMRRDAFSTALLPADAVVRKLKGDCTEHAMLLAALCRVKGIPSRIASGLLHTNQQIGFVGHAWVEALIDGEWLPFDSAIGRGGPRAIRIKLQHSDMPDSATSGISLFLPVLELAGRASIRVAPQQ